MTTQRRRVLQIDDPLEPRNPPPADPAAARVGRAGQAGLRALYVRLAPIEYEKVARAAFELGVHKRDLVAALITHHVDPHTPQGLERLRQLLAREDRPKDRETKIAQAMEP